MTRITPMFTRVTFGYQALNGHGYVFAFDDMRRLTVEVGRLIQAGELDLYETTDLYTEARNAVHQQAKERSDVEGKAD